MTNIDELTGRELDAAVAEQVLGYSIRWKMKRAGPYAVKRVRVCALHTSGGERAPGTTYYEDPQQAWGDAPALSDDDANAWPAVLDAMEARGWEWILRTLFQGGGYYCSFECPLERPVIGVSRTADTRAEAVCRAALRALAAEEEGA